MLSTTLAERAWLLSASIWENIRGLSTHALHHVVLRHRELSTVCAAHHHHQRQLYLCSEHWWNICGNWGVNVLEHIGHTRYPAFKNSEHFYFLSFGHSKTRTQIPSGLVRMFTKIQLINSFLFILWPKYAENLYGFYDCCPLRQNFNTAKPSLSFPAHCSETESSPTLDAANLRQSLPNAICLCGWVRCCTAWEYWFVPASLGGQSRVVGVCWHKGSHCGSAVCVSDTYVAQRARHRHSYPQNPTTMLICHLDAYFYPTSVSTAVIDKGAGGAFEKYQASAF